MIKRHKKAVGETPPAFRFYPHHYRVGTSLHPALIFNLPFVKDLYTKSATVPDSPPTV